MGDGMVSMGSMIVKHNVNKIRRIPYKGGDDPENKENKATIVGFAGSTADAFTLLERLEGKLDEYPGQLARSCVELAKGWRMDKYLRRLEASLIVADESVSLELTGNGDVLESQDGILGVGSGGPYAVGTCVVIVSDSFHDFQCAMWCFLLLQYLTRLIYPLPPFGLHLPQLRHVPWSAFLNCPLKR
jgi:ATP-dependent HslUV protease subunit HslV